MSGADKVLVDTNILVYIDNGSKRASGMLEGKHVYLSFISEMELLGFPDLSKAKLAQLEKMLSFFTVINFDERIKRQAIILKQQKKLKIPDAIIAATAIVYDLPLLTADNALSAVTDLRSIVFKKLF